MSILLQENNQDDRITALEAENARLSRLLFFFETALNKMPYGIQIFDKEGFSFKLNSAQKELLGIPNLEEGIGHFNVLTDAYTIANGVNKLYEQAYKGKTFSHEYEYNLGLHENQWKTRKDKITIHETVFPLENQNHEVEYVVSVLSDITQLKLAEQQLLADKKELEEKNDEIEAQNQEYRRVNQELSEVNKKAAQIQHNLNEAQRISQVGNWYLQIQRTRLTWSAVCYQIFDIPTEITEELHNQIKNKILPADLTCLLEIITRAIHNKTGFTTEFSSMVKGQVKNILLIAEPVFDTQGELCGLRGILQDITEQKKVRQELIIAREKAIESEKQFRMLLDNAPEPLYILIDYKFVYVNIAALKLYGVNNDKELLNSNIFDRIHPDTLEAATKRLLELHNQNRPYNSVESKHIKMDGSPVEVEVSAVPIRFNNFNANLVIIKDIHERYQAQKALKHSHDLMSYIIEHNRSAIAVHDRDLKYIYVSQRYLADYKISEKNIIGKHHYEVFPDLPQKWREVHQRSLRGEIVSAEDDQYMKADGSVEWTRWESRPWYEADNSIGGIIIYTEVITERKKMEEALKQTNSILLKAKQKAEASEAQFRYLLENAPVPMFIQTKKCFAYVNNALISLYKATNQEQLLGTLIKDRVHPDYLELVDQRIKALNEKKTPVSRIEYKHIALDLTELDVEVSAVPILFNDENGAIVFVNDITSRKQIEKKLIESERILKLFVEYAPASIAMFDKDMRYMAHSRRFISDYQLEETNLVGKLHYEVFPEVPERWKEIYQSCLQGNIEKCEEDPFPRVNGHIDWIRWEIHPWYLDNQKIGGIILFSEVITERKLIELESRINREQLALAIEGAELGIWNWYIPTDTITFNDRWANMLGYEVPEIKGNSLFMTEIIHPDDLPEIKDKIKEHFEGNISSFSVEYRLLCKDGNWKWILNRGKIQEFDEMGKAVRVAGTHLDITARKLAESELKQSFDLLSNLAEQVPGVIYQYRLYPDGKSAFPYSSSGMYEIYEVTSDEVREDASPVFTRLHPDDYNQVADAITESARTQTLYHVEFRVILPVQGLRWRSCFAKPEKLADGSTLWHGIIMDITEKKQMEKELEIKNEELNTFFDCALDLLGIATTEGYFLRLNKEWENVLGYSVEELLSRKFFDFIHPDDIGATLKTIDDLNNQNQIISFINRYRCKNGGYKWIEWKSYPKGTKVYAAARDVTERMLFETELEERIQTRTRELMNANKELEAFSYSVSHDLRSPLRAIIGYTNILLEDYENKLDDEGKRICHVISSSAEKIGKLIDDLLTFSRLSRNELVLTSFDMNNLINSVCQEILSTEHMNRIKFTMDPLPAAIGDYNMLKQVWINLISNAVKYSSQKEKACVHIGCVENPDANEYFIHDNGVGFDMLYVNKLFGVFQRLHNSRDFEGTGVGLAIVQRIIHRHGGSVRAEGVVGEGATFYITLPKRMEDEEL